VSTAWQGFFVILGVGLVTLVIAALADRRTRRRGEGLTDAGSGKDADVTAPTYSTMTELLRRSPTAGGASSPELLRGATSVALKLASQALANDDRRCLASDPRVLVCDDAVTTVRELIPVWGRLTPGQALTVAAPDFDPSVLETAVANSRAGTRLVQLLTGEADARAALAALTGATPVTHADLQADATNPTDLGHAKLISAGPDVTLII